jgi:hypothetical protein
MKVVEVPDPSNNSIGERPRYAPLTSGQEEMILNRKLESAASHYNALLAWQLEQQKLQYERR